MKRPKDVEEYILSVPELVQKKLRQLRATIQSVAPEAEEKISYGMPYYGLKGRLVYFQAWKSHIGLYIPPPINKIFEKELKKYETSTATIRFPLSEDLPTTLIKKLIKTRVKLNEEKSKSK